MNKEEILRKAQKESNDEMEVQVKDKSMNGLIFQWSLLRVFSLLLERVRGIQ